jgi:UDP-N-acetylmuramate: L-alanyl-gamma-D-glutamyl-meso-diaminopimelate ligase
MAHWRASDEGWSDMDGHFIVHHDGQQVGMMQWGLTGRHNIQNALGVIAVARHLGIPAARIQTALETFAGVKRRQEIRGVVQEITIIDDFAHHPTAIRETLAALHARYAGRRLWAIFEPRSATSRRATFQDDFIDAFAPADRVVIAGLYNPDAIPSEIRLSPERLATDIARRGRQEALYLPTVETIVQHVAAEARGGDVVVIMSNGGFGGIHEKLLEALRRKERAVSAAP